MGEKQGKKRKDATETQEVALQNGEAQANGGPRKKPRHPKRTAASEAR